jgi:type I restriction enzyme M protein
MMEIADPACGTGGFLLSAFNYITKNKSTLDSNVLDHLLHKALRGWEIVDNTARLCVMNLYLHGIGLDSVESPIAVADSLAGDPGARFDMVLTNPPFGKKSSVNVVTDDGDAKRETHSYVREGFWGSTSNSN